MIAMQLKPAEWACGLAFGQKRYDHYEATSRHRMGDLRQNQMACLAEQAVALWAGQKHWLDWVENRAFVTTIEATRAILCDVAANLHVRSTEIPNGRLCVQERNPNAGVYLLCVPDEPHKRINLIGWIRGAAAKNRKYWMQDWMQPCYAVPQSHLLGIDTIPPEDINAILDAGPTAVPGP